jgi:hypothetical protein
MKSDASRINQMECDMTEVKTDIKYIKVSQDKLTNKLDEFIDSIHRQREQDRKEADDKYASKKIEIWIYSLAGLIITAVVSAGLMLILK